MSNISLDQIITAVTSQFPDASPQAQGAGIAAAIMSINDASKVKPKPAPKPVKAVKNDDWRILPVGATQLARLNRLETALNTYHGENYALAVAADFANKGELSDQYNILKAEGSALGLNWAA
jgi:hypothetical protein